jgi:hypothetical protein
MDYKNYKGMHIGLQNFTKRRNVNYKGVKLSCTKDSYRITKTFNFVQKVSLDGAHETNT